jgi:hypothetical protein
MPAGHLWVECEGWSTRKAIWVFSCRCPGVGTGRGVEPSPQQLLLGDGVKYGVGMALVLPGVVWWGSGSGRPCFQ